MADSIRLVSTGQTVGTVVCRVGDWVTLVIDDPNGPLLGLLGRVDSWNDETVSIVSVDDEDCDYGPVHVPYNTIRFVHAVDGPVTEPIEWDPDRPKS